MRYLVLALFLCLAGLVILDRSRRPDPSPIPALPPPPGPGSAGEYVPSGVVAPELDRLLELEDQLAEDLFLVLQDLVAGRLAREHDLLADRLESIYEDQGLGTVEARDAAASSFAGVILDRLPAAPEIPLEEDSHQARIAEQALRRIARDEAVALRLRFLVRRDPAGVHRGSATPATIEFTPPAGHRSLSWKLLQGFTYGEGAALPPEIATLDGKRAAIAGYMISLDGVREVRHFVLVESTWSCCFGLPPELNGVVVVDLPDDRPASFTSSPVMVSGTFEVGEEREDGYVSSLYRLRATAVRKLPRSLR